MANHDGEGDFVLILHTIYIIGTHVKGVLARTQVLIGREILA